jgi:hypothetical protein
MNKLIINQDVLLRTLITQVRYMKKKRKKLFKQSSAGSSLRKTSPTSTQEHDPDM